MASMGTMKRDAKVKAEARGHNMELFHTLPGCGTVFMAKCKDCCAAVVVDIWRRLTTGEAIEKDCGAKNDTHTN